MIGTSPFPFKGMLRFMHIFLFDLRLNVLNSGDRNKTPPHSVAPHLRLQCSQMFNKKDVGLSGLS